MVSRWGFAKRLSQAISSYSAAHCKTLQTSVCAHTLVSTVRLSGHECSLKVVSGPYTQPSEPWVCCTTFPKKPNFLSFKLSTSYTASFLLVKSFKGETFSDPIMAKSAQPIGKFHMCSVQHATGHNLKMSVNCNQWSKVGLTFSMSSKNDLLK